jgi:hypothetical protein
MKPLFLCLISTQTFVPERGEFFLAAKSIWFFNTKLLGIDAWMKPTSSKCLCGSILVLLL